MINIRQIEIEDHKNFNFLYKKIESQSDFMLYEAGERKTTDEQQKAFLEKLVTDLSSTIFLAEENNTLIGFLGVIGDSPNKRKYSRYVAMGILDGFQGKKIGTKLMQKCIDFCESQKVKRIELTVICKNEKAVNLYKKFGFEIEGVKKCSLFIREEFVDEYFMVKIL